MRNKTKGKLIRYAAVALCVGAPLGATFSQFPVWIDRSSESTVSGLFILLACICCVPFWKQIRAYLKSPSIWGVWIVFTVLAIMIRNIIDEMVIVGVVGVASNVPGAMLYAFGKHLEGKPERKDE